MTVSLYVRISSGAKRRYVLLQRSAQLALCYACVMRASGKP